MAIQIAAAQRRSGLVDTALLKRYAASRP